MKCISYWDPDPGAKVGVGDPDHVVAAGPPGGDAGTRIEVARVGSRASSLFFTVLLLAAVSTVSCVRGLRFC